MFKVNNKDTRTKPMVKKQELWTDLPKKGLELCETYMMERFCEKI